MSKVGKNIPDNAMKISDELGVCKPDGEIYFLGAHQLGVRPKESIKIGVNFHVDAITAHTYGRYLRSYWVNRNRDDSAPGLPEGFHEIYRLTAIILIKTKIPKFNSHINRR